MRAEHVHLHGRCGGYEHLQGRSNNLTYQFMFALEEEQLTEHAEGFLACYRTSEQRLDDIIAVNFHLEEFYEDV